MIDNNEKITILLAGEGGQGIQTIAKALVAVANDSGYEVLYIPYFGVEQRGTPSIAYVTISKSKTNYPKFIHADIAVILRERAIKQVESYITPNTKVIFDSSTIDNRKLPKLSIHKLGVPATKIAIEKNVRRSYNVLIFGALSKLLKMDKDRSWKSILTTLTSKFKTKEIKEKNHDVFDFGYNVVFEKNHFSNAEFASKIAVKYYKNSERIAKIDPKLCKGCRICILKCPTKSLSDSEDLGVFALPVPKLDLATCIACGKCKSFCPDGAIAVEKKK